MCYSVSTKPFGEPKTQICFQLSQKIMELRPLFKHIGIFVTICISASNHLFYISSLHRLNFNENCARKHNKIVIKVNF